MQKQNYSNHTRYYTLHHFIFHPVTLALFVFSLYLADEHADNRTEFYLIASVVALVGWLSFMVRQHYGLILQNRIVRLEMRVRYFQLTGQRFEPLEAKLTFRQIAALRFAGDDELLQLIERSLREQLSSKEIKKSITDWQADHMRV